MPTVPGFPIWPVPHSWLPCGSAIPHSEIRIPHFPVLQPHRQFVWSVRYTDALVRRDTNTNEDDLCDDETLYALGDANFNTTALVNAAGTVLERYVYDPYGRVTVMDGAWTARSGSLYESTVLFAGYWRDSETGLYHVRNRMYHVHLGLWLQRDPEGYVDGMSLYEYVRSRPVGYADPSGEGVGEMWDSAMDELRAFDAWVEAFNTAVLAQAQNTIGLAIDSLQYVGEGGHEGAYVGDSHTPYHDPSTGLEQATRNRVAALEEALAEDPVGTIRAAMDGLARDLDGVFRGDPVACGKITTDFLTAKGIRAAGKASGVTQTVKQFGATVKVTAKKAAGKVAGKVAGKAAKAVSGKADDLASKVDDASTRAVKPAHNTAVTPRKLNPQTRPLSQKFRDFKNNPDNWERVSASAEKARVDGGVSIESTFRHKTTGETLHVHDVCKQSGAHLRKHPHPRAYGK